MSEKSILPELLRADSSPTMLRFGGCMREDDHKSSGSIYPDEEWSSFEPEKHMPGKLPLPDVEDCL